MKTRYVCFNYSTNLTADDDTLTGLVVYLMRCVDDTGEPVEFGICVKDSPGEILAAKRADELARKKLEEQGKVWLQQYERAERLQKELEKLKKEGE